MAGCRSRVAQSQYRAAAAAAVMTPMPDITSCRDAGQIRGSRHPSSSPCPRQSYLASAFLAPGDTDADTISNLTQISRPSRRRSPSPLRCNSRGIKTPRRPPVVIVRYDTFFVAAPRFFFLLSNQLFRNRIARRLQKRKPSFIIYGII